MAKKVEGKIDGRTKLAKSGSPTCIVEYMYVKNRKREKYNSTRDKVELVDVDPFEKEKHIAYVQYTKVRGDNGFRWMLEMNEKLHLADKDNSVRILKITPPKSETEDAEGTPDVVPEASENIVNEA